MSNEYGAIPLTIANDVGSNLKKKMGSLTGFAPVDWAETINKLGDKLPERTVSGAVCSFSDGADDVPMTEVKANITAVQAGSGDPSPSNVRAISGFTTLNFSNVRTVNICDNVFEQGGINVNTGENATGANYSRTENYIAIKANQEYYCKSGSGVYAFFYDDNKRYLGYHGSSLKNKTFTPESLTNAASNGKTFALASFVRFRYGNGTFNNDFCVNYPSTDTDLHTSYAGETIPVWMGGVNIWDEQWEVGGYNNSTGEPYANTDRIRSKANDYIHITPSTTYYFKSTATAYMLFYKEDKTFIRYDEVTKDTTFTTPSNAYYMRFRMAAGYGTTYNNNISINYPATETGHNACRYIYGGELNLTTGVLTVTHGYIASYDGETINEPWISSIDKYVAGNSPSTGAQVVYPLTTPTTIQLTPEEVRSFLGMNNLWANTGDSECTYFAQPNVPEEVLYKGQISTTSDYATANFTGSVADDEEILVKVYCPARSAVDYKVIKVSDIGNGLNVGFSLHTTVNCTITKTSIASYQYSGDYYDIYADVLAYDSAIFN